MTDTIEKTYSITKEHCQSMIKGVCRECGGELTPIETVDNGGNPTFWAGCLKCEIFCNGVDETVYEIARKLVDEKNYVHYHHMRNTADDKSEWYADYYRRSQISGACYIVRDIIHYYNQIKTNTP